MTVYVRYFASLRDRLGRAEDRVSVTETVTVAEIWTMLWPETPLPVNTLAAVNLEYANLQQLVRDGDELAFFPPVTGG
ncbi:MAG: MoaD/ThiS family protein [Candidatus Competibacteraceae bacterium]|nr:MoaD/ThiS family protein [Candidatus Competibacteraceae bacterium]